MSVKMKIAFVCVGNTCRSPMAMFILKDELKRRKIKGVAVTSYGLNPTEKEINPYAKRELEKLDVKITAFKPKKLTNSSALKQSAIIAVTEDVLKEVLARQIKNAYSFEQLFGCGLDDPYGKGEEAYADCALKLKNYAALLADMITEIIDDERRKNGGIK